MSEEPLIYTTKGNVPISSLNYKHYWEDGLELVVSPKKSEKGMGIDIEKDGYMSFIEEYSDKETGEIVKRNVAIYRYKGLDLGSGSGGFG